MPACPRMSNTHQCLSGTKECQEMALVHTRALYGCACSAVHKLSTQKYTCMYVCVCLYVQQWVLLPIGPKHQNLYICIKNQ